MTDKIKGVLTAVFIIFLSLLTFFIAAEIFFRIFNKYHIVYDVEMWKYAKTLKKKSPDNILIHQHRPGAEKLMGHEIKINSRGLRDFDYPYKKAPGIFRILVLGDSITLGWGVEFTKTYPKVLETRLHKSPLDKSLRYEVINTGAGNWNTQQEWRFFELEAHKYDPDLIILGFCINDAETSARYMKTNILFKHSYLLVNLWSRWNYLKLRFGKKADYREYYRSLYKDGTAEGWLTCKQTIDDMSAYSRDNAIDLLITIFPDLHNLDENYTFKGINALVSAQAEENKVHVYDLFDKFYGQAPESMWVSHDDTHPNAKAHKLIADGIYEYLTAKKLLHKDSAEQ